MTSIVGVTCQEGIVIGADSAVMFSAGPSIPTMEQQTQKIDIIESSIIVAGTGSVGLHQRFTSIVRQAFDGSLAQTFPPHMGGPQKAPATGKVFSRTKPLEIVKTLSRAAVEDMNHTYIRQGGYGALLAFTCQNEPYLCEFQVSDFQPELKEKDRSWYVSMGSAQPITDPFLGFIRRVFWADGAPSLGDGIFAVFWTLQHAIELNTGGVKGPIRIAALEKSPDGNFKAQLFEETDLAEHKENITNAEAALRDFRKLQQQEGSMDTPDVPKLGEK